jgi:hypothetical protein
MVILVGIMGLVFLCSSIIILSSLTISLQQKKKILKKNKDPYSFLFDIYDE